MTIELTKKQMAALAAAARCGIEECWSKWIDSGEAKEMGVTGEMHDAAWSAMCEIERKAK